MGELVVGVYSAGDVSDSMGLFQVRREDTDESEISGYILIGWCWEE